MSVAMSSDGSSNASLTVPIVVSTKNDHLTTLFSNLPEPSGCTLFILSIRDEVNMEVGRRMATMLTVLKPSTIYQNQERLNTDLTSVLYHLRGPDAHQVGNAAFLILYVVHNEDECLHTASIIVSPDDTIPFDKYVSDFQSQYVLPWHQYCNVAIHSEQCSDNRNSAIDTTKTDKVHVDVQGNVLFPNLDWALVLLREVQTHLAAFFDVQWASINEGQIPWDDVIVNQSKYIKTPLPSNGGSPATRHEEINWLKHMGPQRDLTPDSMIADLSKNPTKTPNEEVMPPIAEELIIVEKLIIVERPATPFCPPPESPLLPVPQEMSDVPPVKVAAKVKRARGHPKKVMEAGTKTSKDTKESKKQKSPVSGHPKEPATKHIKPNAELPIPPRHST
ncbi:hypothetical protein EDD85DRAFT_790586 [Armillaria nabsnona]|nr:hypothetical protein EDD85DRAFT_790586 [Armillaria nabsnona]